MMKRVLSAVIAALMLVAFSASAYAASLSSMVEENGDSVLGTFMLADSPESYKKFWNDFTHSDYNMMFAAAGSVAYWMFILPPNAKPVIKRTSGDFLEVVFNAPVDYIHFIDDPSDPHKIMVSEMGTLSSLSKFRDARYLVAGSFFSSTGTGPPVNIGYDYIVEYEGRLLLRTDIDDEEDDDGGLLGWLKKIWEWLSSFWDKLMEFCLSLFIPRDGYFDDWFEEIRVAFDKKTGGLSSVFDDIQAEFSNIRGSGELVFGLPPNYLYDGFSGVNLDIIGTAKPFLDIVRPVLTGIIALLTAFACYRKLAAMVKT